MIRITIDDRVFKRKLESLREEIMPLIREQSIKLMEDAYVYMKSAGNIPIFNKEEYSQDAWYKLFQVWNILHTPRPDKLLYDNLYFNIEEDVKDDEMGIRTGIGNVERLDRLIPQHSIVVMPKNYKFSDGEPRIIEPAGSHGHWYYQWLGINPEGPHRFFEDAKDYIGINIEIEFGNRIMKYLQGKWNSQ